MVLPMVLPARSKIGPRLALGQSEISGRREDVRLPDQGLWDAFFLKEGGLASQLPLGQCAELLSLREERDPGLFFEGLLGFAARLEAQDLIAPASEIYAAVISLSGAGEGMDEAIRRRARERLNAIQGKGAFGPRAEFLLKRFTRDATDAKVIVPMLAGSAVYGLVRTASLGRLAGTAGSSWWTRGAGARFAASSAGFVAEVPTFALGARALRPLGQGVTEQPPVAEELAGATITLGFLKGFGFFGNQSFLRFHRMHELGAAQRWAGMAPYTRFASAQGGMFLGLMTAHKVEERIGLRPHVDDGTAVTDTLASMFSLGVGAHLGYRVLGPRFAAFQREMGTRAEIYSKFAKAKGLVGRGRLSLAANPLLAPIWMMMGAGGPGGMGFSATGSKSFGREILVAEADGRVPDLASLKWLRRRCVDQVREELGEGVEGREYLGRLAKVHTLLERPSATASDLKSAWKELRAIRGELGLEISEQPSQAKEAEKIPAKKTSPPVAPRPASPVGPKRPKSVSLQNLEKFQARARLVEEAMASFVASYREVELSLPPEVQDRYLPTLQKLETLAKYCAQEARDVQANPQKRSFAELKKVADVQAQLFNESKALSADLAREPLLKASAQGYNLSWGLRDYQERMLEGLKSDLESGKHPWLGLASPMQTGKSFLIGPTIQILQRHYGPELRVLVLSSARVITGQLMRDLVAGFPISRLGRFDGLVKDPKAMTVASVPALLRNLNDFSREGPIALINDEAYSTQTPSVQEIYSYFRFAQKLADGSSKVEFRPRQGKGVVIGLSGTGAGLKGYHVSGELNLVNAIKQGWIRHMIGEREFLRIESEETEKDGETMIWWRPTPQNAEALAEIYRDKIHGAYEDSLLFVPTIRHGELLKQALEGALGEGRAKLVHSQMPEPAVEQELLAWGEAKGPLISVKKLSRGFRGTGVGAVFHTYQTSSMELFAQRTGRAWGLPEGAAFSPLFVLEATWNGSASFANLARLLGLADYDQPRFRTEGLDLENLPKSPPPKEAIEAQAPKPDREADGLFRKVPLLEGWRTLFEVILQQAGGISPLRRKTDLSEDRLAGYALGALPVRLGDMLSLKEFLGGRDKAEEIWVRSWEDVVDQALNGESSLAGPGGDQLVAWRRGKGAVAERAKDLDRLLTEMLPQKRLEGRSRLVEATRKMAVWNPTRAEAEGIVREAAVNFLTQLSGADKDIFQKLILSERPLSLEEYVSEKEGREASKYDLMFMERVRKRFLGNPVSRQIALWVKERHGGKNLDKIGLPPDLLAAFRQTGLSRFGELLDSSAPKLLSLPGVTLEAVSGLRLWLSREWGVDLPLEPHLFEVLKRIPIAKSGLKESGIRLLAAGGITDLFQFTQGMDLQRAFLIEGLDLSSVHRGRLQLEEWLRIEVPQDSRKAEVLPRVPLTRLGFSKRLAETLERHGISAMGDLFSTSPAELLKIKGVGFPDVQEITECLRLFGFGRKGYFYRSSLTDWKDIPLEKIGLPEEVFRSLKAAGIAEVVDLPQLGDPKFLESAGLSAEVLPVVRAHLEEALLVRPAQIDFYFQKSGAPIETWQVSAALKGLLMNMGYRRSVDIPVRNPREWLEVPGMTWSLLEELVQYWGIPPNGSKGTEYWVRGTGHWADGNVLSLVPLKRMGLPSPLVLDLRSAHMTSVEDLRIANLERLWKVPDMTLEKLALIRVRLRRMGLRSAPDQLYLPLDQLKLPKEMQQALSKAGVAKLEDLFRNGLVNYLRDGAVTMSDFVQVCRYLEERFGDSFGGLPDQPETYRIPVSRWASPLAEQALARDGVRTLGDLLRLSNQAIQKARYFSKQEWSDIRFLTRHLKRAF